MSFIALDEGMLQGLRHRRYAGEGIKAMAAELGLSWQKLDKAIRNGLPTGPRRRRASSPTNDPTGLDRESQEAIMALLGGASGQPLPLTERYRPRDLATILGQPKVVKALQAFTRNPYSAAFLFEGETGTGKTSTAVALAAALGCQVDQADFGGVTQVASGEQTAANVQETCQQLHNRPLLGSGWRVVIVNEADKMTPGAEAIWLDRLEQLPRQTVVIFTTNFTERLPQRFLDRCQRLKFDHDPKRLSNLGSEFLKAVYLREAQKLPPPGLIEGIVKDVTQHGEFSFRRALQLLTPHVQCVKGDAL